MGTSQNTLTSLPRFPYKILSAAILITLATLLWFAYFSLKTVDVFRSTMTHDFRAIELRGKIMQMDEVLTMSARMGVVTGDSSWEKRYNYYDPILVSAIDEAALIVPFSELGASANTTNGANVKLVDMERRAFALSKEGKSAEAKAILFSSDYEEQKKIYATGMEKYSNLLQLRAEERLKSEITNTYYSLSLIVVDFIASIIAWVLTYKSISRWHIALNNAMAQELKYKKEIEDARDLLEKRVIDRTAELEQKNNELRSEVIQREKAEEIAVELSSKLILSAKRAGMSEIATSVLHNVGNVLNSAKTSIGLPQENIGKTDVGDVAKVSALLQENKAKLNEFLFEDAKGRLVLGYLMTIGPSLRKDNDVNIHEVKNLMEHLRHIEDIISMQQTISGVSGVIEKVYVADIFDKSIQMCGDVFEKRNIEIYKNIGECPLLSTDKSKILQIIVNLIQNAKDSLSSADCNSTNKKISIMAELLDHGSNKKVRIVIKDNGVGIKSENLVSIFSLGFTTKPTGHGYGLHSSALIAKELGGEIKAESDGVNKGATFTLTLPLEYVITDSKKGVTNDIYV
jgi:signal transduction histidine kinase